LTMLVRVAAAKRVAAPRLRTNDMLNKVKGSRRTIKWIDDEEDSSLPWSRTTPLLIDIPDILHSLD
jgi:hypothetical protein